MREERVVRSVLRQWRAKKTPGSVAVSKLPADEKRLQLQLLAIVSNPGALKAQLEKYCAFDADKAYNRWREKQQAAKRLRLWRSVLRCCATAVLLFLFLIFAPEPRTTTIKAVETVLTAPPAQQRWLTLEDGTQVWLNNASKLRYPTHFDSGLRRVELTGEAYFEVAKDIARPFIVRTGKQETKVLATSFDVKAYPNETIIKTTVIAGRVVVRSAHDTVILKADEQLRLDTTGRYQGLEQVAAGEAIAWKDGYLDFNHSTLQDVLHQVERRYDLRISFNIRPREIRWRGTLPPNAPLSQLLDFFEANHIHCRLSGHHLSVRAN